MRVRRRFPGTLSCVATRQTVSDTTTSGTRVPRVDPRPARPRNRVETVHTGDATRPGTSLRETRSPTSTPARNTTGTQPRARLSSLADQEQLTFEPSLQLASVHPTLRSRVIPPGLRLKAVP